MYTSHLMQLSTRTYLVISALCLAYVSIQAMISPQSVMDLVAVELTNPDAISSIRGIYGGVGLSIVISLIYLTIYHPQQALLFLMLFWGSYILSRLLTMLNEGALGSFGQQWLMIETGFFSFATILWLLCEKTSSSTQPNPS